jgi:hypothetical protein
MLMYADVCGRMQYCAAVMFYRKSERVTRMLRLAIAEVLLR